MSSIRKRKLYVKQIDVFTNAWWRWLMHWQYNYTGRCPPRPKSIVRHR